jgi:subtilisin family serine protease
MTIRFNWKTVALALLILFAIAEAWGAPTAHMSEDLLPLVKGQAGAVDSLVSVVVFLGTDSEAPAMIPADRPMTRAERIKTVTRTLRQVRPRAAVSVEAVLDEFAHGPIRRLWIVPAYAALVPVATVDRLAKMDGVKAIVSDLALEFDEPVSVAPAAQASPTLSTHLQLLNIPAVWSRGITGKGRLVCNFDTGVDILHPALSSKWRGNHASLGASWFSPYYPESEPVDRRGHGTHTMGVMVASDGADTVGAAPDAEWIAAAVIDQGGSLSTTISDILEAFQWVLDPDGDPSTTDDVPDVILNSWGLPRGLFNPCDPTFWQVVDNVEAAGIVTIFSAGNEGPDEASLRSPADRAATPLTNFAVGAVDNQMVIAPFSSRGPSSCNGEIKPEVVAPGVAVRSSYKNGGYTLMSGTSMAAPYIAGMVALARQFNPDATVAQIKSAILQSCRDLGMPGEDNAYGWGLPNAEMMINLLPLPESPRFQVASYEVLGRDWLLPGDTAALNLELVNLGGSMGSITGRLSSLEQDVTILLSQSQFEFAFGVSAAENKIPFRLIVGKDVPHGRRADFRLDLIDYQAELFDSLFFSIIVGIAPEGNLATHQTGRIDWTITDFGQYGLGQGSIHHAGGTGFSVKGSENLLYEAGLIVGRSEAQLSSSVRGADGQWRRSDFVASETLSSQLKSAQSRMVAGLRDNNSGTPIPVKIWQTTRSFTDWGHNGFVLVEYDVINVTLSRVTSLYLGFLADFDLSRDGDELVFDHVEKLMYQKAPGQPLVGIVALENVRNWVMADNGVTKRGFSDTEKLGLVRSSSVPAGGELVGDGFMVISSGSVDLDVRDTLHMAFALVVGDDVSELYENARAAREAYLMPTGVFTDGGGLLPGSFELAQNYPNPFNPTTTIAFEMKRQGAVRLDVYNMLGQRVTTLFDGPAAVGSHTVEWDGMADGGTPAASGVYFYRVEANGENQTRKMMLIK